MKRRVRRARGMITPEQLNQSCNGNRRVGFQQQECEKAPFSPAPKGQRSAIMLRLEPSEQAKFHPQSSPWVRVAVTTSVSMAAGRDHAETPENTVMVQEPGRVAYRCLTKSQAPDGLTRDYKLQVLRSRTAIPGG